MKTENTKKTLGLINTEKRLYETNPDYQRESGVWSLDKQKLFIDSLINGFDIPKIYLHDYSKREEGQKDGYNFSVVDGKQRLNTIWSFMKNEFSLSEEFEFRNHEVKNRIEEDDYPKKEKCYKDFTEIYKENFKNITVDFVTIVTDEVDDIDELFSRLNNGEPLNSAEKRNAFGGKMASLVREISNHKFFKNRLKVQNKRFSHLEISVKLLRLEWMDIQEKIPLCDLQKKYLDDFVLKNKDFDEKDYEILSKTTQGYLKNMCEVFFENDRLLSKATFIQIYYVIVKIFSSRYSSKKLFELIRIFIDEFEKERSKNNKKDEQNRDTDLDLYSMSALHGASSKNSMKDRIEILEKFFIKWNADKIKLLDPKRRFNNTEREYIWNLHERTCQICKKKFPLMIWM